MGKLAQITAQLQTVFLLPSNLVKRASWLRYEFLRTFTDLDVGTFMPIALHVVVTLIVPDIACHTMRETTSFNPCYRQAGDGRRGRHTALVTFCAIRFGCVIRPSSRMIPFTGILNWAA